VRENWAPGWSAVIIGDRLLLDSPTSAGWYSASIERPAARGGERRYVTPASTLVIESGACSLIEYRHMLPDRAILEWDGGRFEGCAGPRSTASETAGTVWELVRLGGAAAPAGRSPPATLIFSPGGALGGTLACNDGGIRTTWTEGGFVAHGGGFESTAMGCNDPRVEEFGRRFWNGLVAARAWRRDGDRLVIILADGSEAELRRLL
jgi:heat shock protein HslJ